MDQIDIVPVLVRWIHIVAAVVAIGGATFMAFAFVPSLRETLDENHREKLTAAVRGRWGKIVHLCIAVLLLTGAGNFVLLALKAGLKPMPYHALFGLKFIAAMVIFFLASALVGRSPGFAGMRQRPAGPLKAIVGLGVLIILLSGVMSSVRHSPSSKKATTTDTPTATLTIPQP